MTMISQEDIQNAEHDAIASAKRTVDSSSLMAQKVTVVGDVTYSASAIVGSLEASAVWQAQKVTVSGSDTTVTWADGDTLYDNVATDLTALTYS